jgi:hypothetical protein
LIVACRAPGRRIQIGARSCTIAGQMQGVARSQAINPRRRRRE